VRESFGVAHSELSQTQGVAPSYLTVGQVAYGRALPLIRAVSSERTHSSIGWDALV